MPTSVGALFQNPIVKPLSSNATFMSGCTATFYLTETTNFTPIYADGTLATPLANPLAADASGTFPAIYLDPNVIYRVQIKTSAGVLISDTDPYVPSSVSLLTQSFIGSVLYPRTAGEISAGATPVNFSYPPMYVDRYGTNTTPGTTSMTAAFQAAINVMRLAGGKVRWGATAPYLLDGALDCTFSTSANQRGLYFDGSDAPVATDSPAGIIAKHTGYVFDLTGCDAYSFNNMSVGTDAVTFPKVCFFMARANVAGNNSQIPRFHNVRVQGSFSKSLMYNYASEDGVYTACYFSNQCAAAGTKVVTITATNIFNLASTFTTIRTGSQSCTDHEFFGGQFWNAAGQSDSDVFYLDNCTGLKCYGFWMLNSSGSAGGRAYFYVDCTNGAAGHIKLRDIVGEDTTFYHQYGVFFSNVAQTASDWTIQACYLPNTVQAISAGALVTLDKFDVGHIGEQASNGMTASGTVQFSTIDSGTSLPLTIGTSKQNVLMGVRENNTITTRNKDYWIDTGRGTDSWTPNTSGITFSGGTPVASASAAYNGRQVTIGITLSGQTTLTVAAGNQITNLPAAPIATTAQVSIWDVTANVSLGVGYITGGAIVLPAFTVTSHTVQISATYSVA